MLPSATLPPSLQRLLNHFWPCFTRPTFATFAALITGLITHTGPRTICGMLTGSGLARLWPHHRAHAFFSHRRWDPHHLGRAMAHLIVATCTEPGQDLTLIADDTLIKRSGRHVFGRYRQHDGSRPARDPMAWGVCHIVTALAIRLPGRTKTLALPTLTSCWRPSRTRRTAGRARKRGHAPHPHTAHLSNTAATARVLDYARARYTQAGNGLAMRLDKEAALPPGHHMPGTDPKAALKARLAQREEELATAQADHDQALARVLEQSRPATAPTRAPDEPERPTKTETAIALATQQARLFTDRRVHVVTDAAYQSPALRVLPANLSWTFRLLSSAVLSQPPPPVRTGSPTRPGRPAYGGPRLGTAAQIAAGADFLPLAPGSDQYLAVIECRWPRSLGPLALRLILVRHARSAQLYDLALLTTDTTSEPAQILGRYADRWPIEVCFQDTRAHLGLEQARNRTRAAIERTVPFQLLAYSLVVLWYRLHGQGQADVAARRRQQPWYRSKTEPAFSDMIAALRRQVIEHRISCRVSDLGMVRLIREIVSGQLDTAA